MKYIYSIFILFCSLYLAQAQTDAPFPCGTLPSKSAWLTEFQRAPHAFRQMQDTLLYIPITIHQVNNTADAAFFSHSRLLDALCTLNNDYAPVDIQFYIAGEIQYISDPAINSHATVLEGANAMFANNVPNTLNCYIVTDPAGNCGYNLPYAGIALSKNCMGPFDHTWAHEVGHALSLPHPFLGWEGGVSWDNSVPYNYNDPAPERVLYNYTFFKDTLILDTLIIDTAWVEKVDRSNCSFAADGFCDTQADYLNYRWQCNADGVSSVIQHDPNNVAFQSDASLIMSYATDDCSNRFSSDQAAAMRANLLDEKADWLTYPTPEQAITTAPTPITPVNDATVPANFAQLIWEPIPSATHYNVRVYRRVGSSSILIEERIVTENTATFSLTANKPYEWDVRPNNNFSFCTEFSDRQLFMTGDVSATVNVQNTTPLSVYPNPAMAGQSVYVSFETDKVQEIQVQVYNLAGQLVHSQATTSKTGAQVITLQQLPKGLLFVQLVGEKVRGASRFVVD